MKAQKRFIMRLLTASAVYAVLTPFVFLWTNDFTYMYFGWNILLSAIPLLLSGWFARKPPKRIAGTILLFGFWLLFLPNALYFVTDLIYVADHVFAVDCGPYCPTVYLDGFRDWLALVDILIGVILSLAMGTFSIALMKRTLKTSVKAWILEGGTVLVSLLCGLGVYIGRFLRYNSWNLFSLPALLRDLSEAASWDMLGFVLLISGLQYLLLVLFVPLIDPPLAPNTALETGTDRTPAA